MRRSDAYDRCRRFVLLLAVSSLAVLGPATSRAAAEVSGGGEASGAGPVLTGAAGTGQGPGTVLVTGERFTASGEVYVALYDRWGAQLHETRWTTAGLAAYGPNGSADPAVGFRPGGAVGEAFGGLCGATAMVRAYDQRTARWSNWLDVDAAAAGLSSYGPNGSADPALGFRSVGLAAHGPNGSADPALGFRAGC